MFLCSVLLPPGPYYERLSFSRSPTPSHDNFFPPFSASFMCHPIFLSGSPRHGGGPLNLFCPHLFLPSYKAFGDPLPRSCSWGDSARGKFLLSFQRLLLHTSEIAILISAEKPVSWRRRGIRKGLEESRGRDPVGLASLSSDDLDWLRAVRIDRFLPCPCRDRDSGSLVWRCVCFVFTARTTNTLVRGRRLGPLVGNSNVTVAVTV